MSKTAAPCIVIFELLKTGASPRSFDCGGQIPTGGGGRIQVSQNHLTHIRISPRISPILFWKDWEIQEMVNIQKISF